ncbi:hypothetical protein TNCV_4409601 [Trichonephila clavipes]|nr:hypothetical protein TNCV_4409601 [Trichonephila clavipes]
MTIVHMSRPRPNTLPTPNALGRPHHLEQIKNSPYLGEICPHLVLTIDKIMLQNVWVELVYRLDLCPVTKGAHIEDL